ncbi:permease, cadmium resistance protein [Fructobacillus pseudoficulneus]|uniref:Permease, cadmium resistance protein n=1 Tax=Fructobacillus pseudoficulneus TaxID=220714 RepID=A0A3F3H548_9LACO|nr:cadmium resistance transporter [Fructobacillus pseudoficulneus]GAP03060.1 permease, cadmium resistance protein [Fructobacillus pseudoficulneus]SEH41696.1 cadmium resistance transporter (or sequestration) family protein [Fructobacillus pseudoficulneus]
MLATLLTGLFSYLGTTSDYFVILILLFATFRQGNQVRPIVIGAYLGNVLLVLISLLIGGLLKQVPAEWALGFLGLVPIVLGLRNYLAGEGEDEGAAFVERVKGRQDGRVIWTVVLMTLAGCGADNLALYIPYFSLADWTVLPWVFLLFAGILTGALILAYRVARIKRIQAVFERFGDLIQLIVYVVLGIYILFEAGTVTEILSLL